MGIETQDRSGELLAALGEAGISKAHLTASAVVRSPFDYIRVPVTEERYLLLSDARELGDDPGFYVSARTVNDTDEDPEEATVSHLETIESVVAWVKEMIA